MPLNHKRKRGTVPKVCWLAMLEMKVSHHHTNSSSSSSSRLDGVAEGASKLLFVGEDDLLVAIRRELPSCNLKDSFDPFGAPEHQLQIFHCRQWGKSHLVKSNLWRGTKFFHLIIPKQEDLSKSTQKWKPNIVSRIKAEKLSVIQRMTKEQIARNGLCVVLEQPIHVVKVTCIASCILMYPHRLRQERIWIEMQLGWHYAGFLMRFSIAIA